jgi:hypothetical protein
MLGGPRGGHRPCHPTRNPPPADRARERNLRCAAGSCLAVGLADLPRDRGFDDPQPNGLRQLPGVVNIACESELIPGQLDALLGGGPHKRRNPRPAQR